MHSHISGKSPESTPSPAFGMQPHLHQPRMAAHSPALPAGNNGYKYTQQEIQEYVRRNAALQSPQQMNAMKAQEIQRIREQRALTAQNAQIPTPPPMNSQPLARQASVHNGQHANTAASYPPPWLSPPSMFGSSHPFYAHTQPSQNNGDTGHNQLPQSNPFPQFQTSHGYGFSTKDTQATSTASPTSEDAIKFGLIPVPATQTAMPGPLDPQLVNPSTMYTVSGSTSSQTLPTTTSPTPSSHLPSSTASPPLAAASRQYAGTKRSAPTVQNAHAEGPAPKKGMFPTAAPVRPSSAQGRGIPAPVKRAGYAGNVGERLKREATRQGVSTLDMSEQKFNMRRDGNEIRGSGGLRTTKASTETRDYQQENHAQVGQSRKQTALRVEQAMDVRVPSRPASTIGQVKKPEIIDLTETDTPQNRPQYTRVSQTVAVSTAPAPPKPGSTSPVAQALHDHAFEHGVRMSDVELGSHIESALRSWLMHQEDLSLARSMLEPSLENIRRLCHSPASSNHDAANTMDAAHAEALALPSCFGMATTLQKVRDTGYVYSPFEHLGSALPPTSETAVNPCLKNADARAPEDPRMSEENAHVRYLFWRCAAEKRDEVKSQ
ncbi:hypothetical protein BKA66DRAFT_598157 [Pyrenochaeta sp. MPI-SDFR-AT-0127]|nr:hypothetical protein BKA66DRAFT_598157 [Pyrenochaeta sp. MPI-SDFR-AT-0127]